MNIERVALVSDGPIERQDGVQRYTATLGQWMATQGIDVHYYTSGPASSPNQFGGTVHLLADSVRVQSNGNQFAAAIKPSRRDGLDLVRSGYFDVIHSQLPDGPLVGRRVQREAEGTPTALVGTYHLLPFSPSYSALLHTAGRISRKRHQQLDLMLATSRLVADYAESVVKRECQVLPPAVHLGTSHMSEEVPAGHNRPILSVGRMSRRKGLSVLIDAYAQLDAVLREDHPLELVGDGPDRPVLENQVARLGLQRRVRFLGRLSDEQMIDRLRHAQVAVYPATNGESFGLVLVEAMNAGVPVLAAANSGYRTTMEGLDDQLTPPGSPEGLASAITRFVSESEDVREWRISRQHRVAQKFSLSSVGPHLLKLYEHAQQQKALRLSPQ